MVMRIRISGTTAVNDTVAGAAPGASISSVTVSIGAGWATLHYFIGARSLLEDLRKKDRI